MATQIICDACGEPIDLTQPYFQVAATKVQINNADDPTVPNDPVVVEITQQFDYHDGHQPKGITRPEPTHPIVYPDPDEPPAADPLTLAELDPTSAAKGSTITLRVLGTGFNDTSAVFFSGAEITSTFVSDTELTCSPDTSMLAKGAYSVLVSEDGTDSNSLPFTVT